MTDAALKPCPFCGGKAAMVRDHCTDGGGVFVSITCRDCRASSGHKYHSKGNDCPQFYAEVRDIWNARPSPKVRKLVWDNGESKGGGAKYNMYEVRDGLFNCVVYPHEDTQYRIAEKVSETKAIEAANADYEARILGALE